MKAFGLESPGSKCIMRESNKYKYFFCMKEIREHSEEKTSSGMHTVFIQATFFKKSSLTLRLLQEIIQFSLRIIVKFPFNRITTLLP